MFLNFAKTGEMVVHGNVTTGHPEPVPTITRKSWLKLLLPSRRIQQIGTCNSKKQAEGCIFCEFTNFMDFLQTNWTSLAFNSLKVK